MRGRPPIRGVAGWLPAVALSFLTACGGGGGCTASTQNPNALLYGVPSLAAEGDYYGVTEYTCGGPTLVRISRETPAALLSRVVAHEMLHAAGLVHHEASPACFLYKNAFPGQPLEPCLTEVDRLREVTLTVTISVPDPDLLDTARECAAMWNEHAGREVFVIEDRTPPVE